MNRITRRTLGAMVAAIPLAVIHANSDQRFMWIKKFASETYAKVPFGSAVGAGKTYTVTAQVNGITHVWTGCRMVDGQVGGMDIEGVPFHFNCRSDLEGVLK